MKPFVPRGNTIAITAAVTAPDAVAASVTTGKYSVGQYRVVNAGTVTAFLGFDRVAATAKTNAAVVSTSGAAIPLVPGAVEVLGFSDSTQLSAPEIYFSAATASGTATIYITPGEGI